MPAQRHILLLRGINLGPRNRVAMPELREVLAGAGFEDVRTYVQSGNVVLSTDAKPDALARECERLVVGARVGDHPRRLSRGFGTSQPGREGARWSRTTEGRGLPEEVRPVEVR